MIVTRGLGRKSTAGGPVVTFGLGLWQSSLTLPLLLAYLIVADRVTELFANRLQAAAPRDRAGSVAAERLMTCPADREAPPAVDTQSYRLAAERVGRPKADRLAAVPDSDRAQPLAPQRSAAITPDRITL